MCCASGLKSKNSPQYQMPKNKAPPREVDNDFVRDLRPASMNATCRLSLFRSLLRMFRKLCEATFAAAESVTVFSHEYPLSAPRAVSLISG